MSDHRTTAAPDDEPPRLRCPKCGCPHLPVYWTRQSNGLVRRHRKCRNCGRPIITTERITGLPPEKP